MFPVSSAFASTVSEVSYLIDADGQRVGQREVWVDSISGEVVTNTSRLLLGANPATGISQRWAETRDGELQVYLFGRKPVAVMNCDSAGGVRRDYLLADGMTSVRSTLRGGEGGLALVDSFDGFGTRLASSESESPRGQPGYGGEFNDVATGLYDLRARAYDPELGRFTSPDPFEGELPTPVTRHRYLYAHADPINHLDPSGLVVKHAARDLDGLAWGTHQFLILIPDHPEDFVGDGKGAGLLKEMGIAPRLIGGKLAITAGGHSVGGRLTVQWLERADEMAAVELLDRSYSVPFYQSDFDAESHDIPPPAGLGDTQFILRLLRAMQLYRRNEAVAPIEYPHFGGGLSPWSRHQFNSNAWVSSLLEAVGAHAWPDFSGYDPLRRNRIPSRYFNTQLMPDHPPARRNGIGNSSPGQTLPPLPFP